MYVFTSFVLFFILFVQNESVVGLSDGSNAALGEFPYMVSFQNQSNDNKHFCGGSIIDERFILTAAHCVSTKVFKSTPRIRIVAGVTDLTSNEHIIRAISDVIRHPDYEKSLPKANDIALVKIDPPFDLKKYPNVGKANLPPEVYHVAVGQEVEVAGWGLESATKALPPKKLKKTQLKVYARKECVKKYKGRLGRVENTVFCTIHDNLIHARGVCNGDSGGPVIVDKNMIVGIVKGGYQGNKNHLIKQCGDKKYPDMHTEVAKYRGWIETTIKNNR